METGLGDCPTGLNRAADPVTQGSIGAKRDNGRCRLLSVVLF